jgi:hypothetical protein
MKVLRSTTRDLKTVTSAERMGDVVERYVPLNSLWLKCPGEPVPDRTVGRPAPLSLRLD